MTGTAWPWVLAPLLFLISIGAQTQQSKPPEQILVPDAEKRLLKKVEPAYPVVAWRARVQGPVVLATLIAEDGSIEYLRVISGHPLLVPAAMDAVKQWRYTPFIVEGMPVEVQTGITVNFALGPSPGTLPPLPVGFIDCRSEITAVEVYAVPEASGVPLEILPCGEQVAFTGTRDGNDWFPVATRQGASGYVWMYASDSPSPHSPPPRQRMADFTRASELAATLRYAGSVSGNTYKNDLLGFQLSFPRGWSVLPIPSSPEGPFNLLYISTKLGTPQYRSSLGISASDLSDLSEVPDSKDVLTRMSSALRKDSPTLTMSGDPRPMTHSGHEFYRIEYEEVFPQVTKYVCFEMTILKGFAIGIWAKAESKQGANEACSIADSLKFF